MIRVLLVEDERIVREGIRAILESHGDITVVGELDSGAAVEEAVRTTRPQVALIDLAMPDVDGLETIRRLRLVDDAPAAIVLTTFDTDRNIVTALRSGAVGFLRKATSAETLAAAVRGAAEGDSVLSPGVLDALLAADAGQTAPRPRGTGSRRLGSLSPRELAVVHAVAAGMSNAQIAARLHLSEATVKSYVSRLLTKLDKDNRVQLALLWWEARHASGS